MVMLLFIIERKSEYLSNGGWNSIYLVEFEYDWAWGAQMGGVSSSAFMGYYALMML